MNVLYRHDHKAIEIWFLNSHRTNTGGHIFWSGLFVLCASFNFTGVCSSLPPLSMYEVFFPTAAFLRTTDGEDCLCLTRPHRLRAQPVLTNQFIRNTVCVIACIESILVGWSMPNSWINTRHDTLFSHIICFFFLRLNDSANQNAERKGKQWLHVSVTQLISPLLCLLL